MLGAAVLDSSQPRGDGPVRGLPFWLFAFLLVFSPLPFASVYPVWPALYSMVIAVAILAYLVQRWRLGRGITFPQPAVIVASALVMGVIVWGFVQSLPGIFAASQHPAWEQARASLDMPRLAGALSLVPERSVQVATHYLTYLAFAWLAFWQCRRSRNRALLLKLFIAAQAAYAA